MTLRTFGAWLLAAGAIGLAGCGGGGGGASGTGTDAGTSGTGNGTGGGTTGTPTMTVTLLDANNSTTANLTYGTPVTAQAVLRDGAGSPVPNAIVTFSSDASLATLSPSSGTAMTNASGTATVQVNSASLNAAGAGLVTANATVKGTAATGNAPFTVGAAAVTMTPLAMGSTGASTASISAFGTISLTTTIKINGATPTIPVQVNFTSGCAAIGKATLPASVQAINGVATATYQDKGCAASDTVTASVANTTVSQSAVITVAGPQAANIQFSALAPADGRIVLKGTGGVGYTEVAAVTFKVVDSGGNAVPNQTVTFDLTTRVGNILLDNVATAVSKQTDSAGLVTVNVQSGTVPTPVWVTATTAVPGVGNVNSQSNKLTISTGKPSQDFFSLSVSNYNIEGWGYDGETATLSIIASDRLGNPVPDGTAINFVAEGAQIDSTCSTTGGSCSVTFRSAAYRPGSAPTTNPDSEPSSFNVTAGRVSVLAYALGEMSFIDANNNNVFDTGETIDLLGNAFLDKNESGTWQSGENAIVFDGSRTGTCPYDGGGAPPKLATAPSVAATCGSAPTTANWNTAGAAHVRRNTVITLSGGIGTIFKSTPGQAEAELATISMGADSYERQRIRIQDENGNPIAAQTTLSIESNAVKCFAGASEATASVTVTPDKVPSTNAAGGTYHFILIDGAPSSCTSTPSGSFKLRLTSPKGHATVYTVGVTP